MLKKSWRMICVALFVLAAQPGGIAIADDKPGPAPSPQPSPPPQPVKPTFQSPFGNTPTTKEEADFEKVQAKYDAMNDAEAIWRADKLCGKSPEEIAAAKQRYKEAKAAFEEALDDYIRVYCGPDRRLFGLKGDRLGANVQGKYEGFKKMVMDALTPKPEPEPACKKLKQDSFLHHVLDNVSMGVDVGGRSGHDDHGPATKATSRRTRPNSRMIRRAIEASRAWVRVSSRAQHRNQFPTHPFVVCIVPIHKRRFSWAV